LFRRQGHGRSGSDIDLTVISDSSRYGEAYGRVIRQVRQIGLLEDAMTFLINTANYHLYFNTTGGDRAVTLAVSGQARLEVKTANGAPVSQLVTGGLGGVASLRVPAQHLVEVDAPPAGVQVEVLATQ
jgi:hypothetical protein